MLAGCDNKSLTDFPRQFFTEYYKRSPEENRTVSTTGRGQPLDRKEIGGEIGEINLRTNKNTRKVTFNRMETLENYLYKMKTLENYLYKMKTLENYLYNRMVEMTLKD